MAMVTIKTKRKKKNKKSDFFRRVKIFIKYIKPYKKELYVLSTLAFSNAILAAITPYLVGKFFDALTDISQNNNLNMNVVKFLFLWLLVSVSAATLYWIFHKQIMYFANKLESKFLSNAINRLILFPVYFHKNESGGKVRHKMQRAAAQITWLTRSLVQDYASSIIGIFTGLVMAFIISYKLAIILLTGIILYIILGAFLVKDLPEKQRKGVEARADAYGVAHDILSNIFAVKHFTRERRDEKNINKAFLKAYNKWLKPQTVWANITFAQSFIVTFAQFSIFFLSIKLIYIGEISVGDLVAINAYALASFGPIVQFMTNFGSMQESLVTIEEADKMLSQRPEAYIPKNVKYPKEFVPKVEFKDVWFRYERKQPWVLRGVSFVANPGEAVALVGESGVGKTTSIELLLAYYFPQKGKVLVSGVDTRRLDLTYLRAHIAVVPQETTLLNDTLFKNLKFANEKASEEDIWRALEKAQLKDFVESLPKGLKTIVGERGVKLSVGQKQRISIARAFLKDAPILILDEPTSALDAKTESMLQKAFDELMKGRTTFVIAHRLSTVRKADKILVFEKGQIVESGTHKELLKKENGVYKNLHEFQVT